VEGEEIISVAVGEEIISAVRLENGYTPISREREGIISVARWKKG